MNLKQCFLTKNECYQIGAKIIVQGLMLHSTGADNPNISRYVPLEITTPNNWNAYRPGGRQVCVHGFIGKLQDGTIGSVQTLPWEMRGWHCGGNANNTHIGIEICEDGLADADYFKKVYNEAVELFAYLCKTYNLNPMTQIICHCEGFKKGITSNHADVMHWFPKHGKSMDTFRTDVKAKINETSSNNSDNKTTNTTSSSTNYTVKINTADLNVRSGAGVNYSVVTTVHKNEVYTIVEEKNNGTTKWGKLKSGAGWISLAYTIKTTAQTTTQSQYYPACAKSYASIVSALNSIKVDSSFANRKKIAVKNNVYNYTGTATQNNQLLSKLKAGKLKKI